MPNDKEIILKDVTPIIEELMSYAITDDVYGMGIQKGIDIALNAIHSNPTVNPEDLRLHGKWLERVSGITWECSNCEEVVKFTTPYCPYCAAIMDKK